MNILQVIHENNLITSIKPITEGNRKYVFVSIENKKGYVSRTIPEEEFSNEALEALLEKMIKFFKSEYR